MNGWSGHESTNLDQVWREVSAKDMGVEPKTGDFTTQIIHFNRVFHYKPSIFGVFPLFLETPIFCHLSKNSKKNGIHKKNALDKSFQDISTIDPLTKKMKLCFRDLDEENFEVFY